MAPRIAITIALCLSFLLLVKGIVTTFQGSPLPDAKPGAAKKNKVYKGSRPVKIYPTVPSKLPELDKGYLFNEERNLGGSGKITGDHADLSVNIDDVVYEGSLIIGDIRKAIIAYPSKAVKKSRTPRKPTRRGKSSTKSSSYFRVTEGETISGYKVVEILPEKITFEKGSERIEKLLYDSSKTREITNRPQKPGRKSPTRRNPAAQKNRTKRSPKSANIRQKPTPRNMNQPPIPPEILEDMSARDPGNPFNTGR